jgi:hypothetical protein
MFRKFSTVIGSLSAAALLSGSLAQAAPSHTVAGHTTKRGTYVLPHRQTNPDHTRLNNWSTKGNVNPYTGKPGTKKPSGPK